MTDITLIFPHQLFEDHPALAPGRPVFLAEDFLFFRLYPFHIQKLVLHRSSMALYAEALRQRGYEVTILPTEELTERTSLGVRLAGAGAKRVFLADPVDDWLETDLQLVGNQHGFEIVCLESPGFFLTRSDIRSYFEREGKKKPSMRRFYEWQRRRLGILMENDAPVGGQFSFDTENRKRLPRSLVVPKIPSFAAEERVHSDTLALRILFPDAPGSSDEFGWPLTTAAARLALDEFLRVRLAQFGPYEDALSKTEATLFHSLLSPALNAGLITPAEVVATTLAFAKRESVPIASLEGFLRQIIGWREFIRAIYVTRGREIRSGNFWHHDKPLPEYWWGKGTSGIPPIDITLERVFRTGYAHHIERLMVLGNYMLLTETDPDEIYRWFMMHFIDAYDWVMVPNVYGMSQYADGGSFTTKPYFSASHYLRKMGDYPSGEWTTEWDGRFWSFLEKHHSFFSRHPRLAALLSRRRNHPRNVG